MSTNTPVFGLFQYNPITDGNLPFNITQALNNNWNAIDSLALPAAAAASPYNPSGTYAVGDFCIYNGTLQKCNTPIPSGEAWNAAHWTETSVAAELAEVHDLLAPLGGATTTQAALAVLGAGVRPNLLDNAYFVGGGTGYGTFPVNQKGVLSGNTDRQFICDRWGQFGSEWRLTKDGLVMAKRSDAAYWSFYQQIPVETVHQLVGKVVTVSVLLDSVLVTATQVLVSPVTYFPFENGERA